MSERKPGWYWVCDSQGVWEPAEFALLPEAGYSWWYRCAWYTASDDRSADEVFGCEIGPRIHPPGEVSEALVAAVSRAIFPIISRWAYRDHAKDNRTTEAVANEAACAAIAALPTPSDEALTREVERRREAEEAIDDMIVSATRYCIGRMSYIVGSCDGWLRKWWPHLGVGTRDVILKDIRAALEQERLGRRSLGHQIDIDTWAALYRDFSPGGKDHVTPFDRQGGTFNTMSRYAFTMAEGEAILRSERKLVEGIVRGTRRTMRIAGHVVPVACCPHDLASEVGNALLKEPITVPRNMSTPGITGDENHRMAVMVYGEGMLYPFFSATYYDGADGRRHFSLRTNDTSPFHCGDAARSLAERLSDDYSADGTERLAGQPRAKFIGGGHKNAAGFDAPLGWEGE